MGRASKDDTHAGPADHRLDPMGASQGRTALDRERLFAWNDVLDDANYYEILGILEIADDQAIQRAFHQFALAFHPDVHLDADEALREMIRRLFQRGAEAYRVLSHPKTRAEYDLCLAKGVLRLGAERVPRHAGSRPGVNSLDELCRSAASKLSAKKADQHISQGNLAEAKRELQLALHNDGGDNPELVERIDALDLALYAMGE